MKRKFAAVMLSALAALLLGLSVFFVACEGGTESGGQDTEQGGETGGETGDEEQGDGEETQEPAYTLTYELTGDYYTVTGIESAAEAAEVVIPSSYQGVPVRAVAPHAFWGETFITEIEIPGSIAEIGNYAFQNCTALSSVTIGDGASGFGTGIFLNCTGIREATVPASAVSLLPKENLQTLTVTSGTIGSGALAGCAQLTSLTAPAVGVLGGLFGDTKGVLQSLTLTDCTVIAASAFAGFTALSEIDLPDTITSIGAGALEGTAYFADEANRRFGICYVGQYLFAVSSEAEGYCPVGEGTKVIADEAFKNCTAITEISLPESLITIGASAFSGCGGLTEIAIPASVEHIGRSVFSGCSALTKVNYNAVSAADLGPGSDVFYGTGSASDGFAVVFGESVKSIPAYLFGDCVDLTGVTIGGNVTSIGSSAFRNCRGLKGIAIPASVTSIGEYAFSGCSNLAEVTIEAGATSIGSHAFYNCSSLTEVTMGAGVTSIGAYAFYSCSSLAEITIPEGVTSIGDRAFCNCSGLTEIKLPSSVTSIDSYAFSGCSSLTGITIPEGVTSIDPYAFSNCSKLTSVTFKNTEGWRHASTSTASGTEFASSDLADPSTAADYLTTTYVYDYWHRSAQAAGE